MRDDFRLFRLDRMNHLIETGEPFASQPGKTLEDFLARYTNSE
ncbi:MAG: hypothetical protein P8171_26110 [Candidatus Thiodiazotropha sp.]